MPVDILPQFKKYYPDTTIIIEFSRGSEHGGYRSAFSHMTPEVLSKAAALYVDVSYEESLRKNTRRFNPDKPDSILEHGLPADKMEKLYREIDWLEFTGSDSEYLTVREYSLPYGVLDNSDDVTTIGGEVLGARLDTALGLIWERLLRRSL